MSDKNREAFEAWFQKNQESRLWNTTDAMLLAWQASRKQALEEAGAAFFGQYPYPGDNVRAFKELRDGQ